MANPHTKLTNSTSYAGAPRSNPMSTAQLPDMPIIAAVVLVLPQRSPNMPPTKEPKPPIAMTANVA
jgi:hypothetical protein